MIRKHLRCMAALLLASQLGVAAPTALVAGEPATAIPPGSSTTTPIKHVVVIFQETVSFDHYFATYPMAANPGGEPEFHEWRSTPSVNSADHQSEFREPLPAGPQPGFHVRPESQLRGGAVGVRPRADGKVSGDRGGKRKRVLRRELFLRAPWRSAGEWATSTATR